MPPKRTTDTCCGPSEPNTPFVSALKEARAVSPMNAGGKRKRNDNESAEDRQKREKYEKELQERKELEEKIAAEEALVATDLASMTLSEVFTKHVTHKQFKVRAKNGGHQEYNWSKVLDALKARNADSPRWFIQIRAEDLLLEPSGTDGETVDCFIILECEQPTLTPLHYVCRVHPPYADNEDNAPEEIYPLSGQRVCWRKVCLDDGKDINTYILTDKPAAAGGAPVSFGFGGGDDPFPGKTDPSWSFKFGKVGGGTTTGDEGKKPTAVAEQPAFGFGGQKTVSKATSDEPAAPAKSSSFGFGANLPKKPAAAEQPKRTPSATTGFAFKPMPTGNAVVDKIEPVQARSLGGSQASSPINNNSEGFPKPPTKQGSFNFGGKQNTSGAAAQAPAAKTVATSGFPAPPALQKQSEPVKEEKVDVTAVQNSPRGEKAADAAPTKAASGFGFGKATSTTAAAEPKKEEAPAKPVKAASGFGFGPSKAASTASAAPPQKSTSSFGFGQGGKSTSTVTNATAPSKSFSFGAAAAPSGPAKSSIPETYTAKLERIKASDIFFTLWDKKRLTEMREELHSGYRIVHKMKLKDYPIEGPKSDKRGVKELKVVMQNDLEDDANEVAADLILNKLFAKESADVKRVDAWIDDAPTYNPKLAEALQQFRASELKKSAGLSTGDSDDDEEDDDSEVPANREGFDDDDGFAPGADDGSSCSEISLDDSDDDDVDLDSLEVCSYKWLKKKYHQEIAEELRKIVKVRKSRVEQQEKLIDQALTLLDKGLLQPKSNYKIMKFYPENDVLRFRPYGKVTGITEQGEFAHLCHPPMYVFVNPLLSKNNSKKGF